MSRTSNAEDPSRRACAQLPVAASLPRRGSGRFCDAKTRELRDEEHRRLVNAAKSAAKVKLRCCAGHGIHYDNVGPIASILEIEELNIGHAIVARSMLVGMEKAVREMRDLAWQARRDAISAA